MTEPRTIMAPPVHLALPVLEPPRPAAGCDICAALAKQWRMAMEHDSPAYNPSHATDLAVEISRHPHQKAGR